MDDTKQISNNTNQHTDDSQAPNQQVQDQTTQSSQKPIQQEEWVLPTAGGKTKESAPVANAEPAPTEWVQPSEAPVEISKEVAELGVEAVTEAPKIIEEAAKAGLEAAKEATPVPAAPVSTHPQTPLTEEEAKKEVTGNPVFKDPTSARYWLAMLLTKYFSVLKKKENKD